MDETDESTNVQEEETFLGFWDGVDDSGLPRSTDAVKKPGNKSEDRHDMFDY